MFFKPSILFFVPTLIKYVLVFFLILLYPEISCFISSLSNESSYHRKTGFYIFIKYIFFLKDSNLFKVFGYLSSHISKVILLNFLESISLIKSILII